MTMKQTPHGEFEDALGAYAIGALDVDEKRAFEAHLATCQSCQTELRSMRRVVAGIGLATEPVPPPELLKARVIAHATSQPQPTMPGAKVVSTRAPGDPAFVTRQRWTGYPLALAASLALALGAGIYALSLRSQVRLLQDTVAQASAQSASLRDLLNDARRDAASLRTTIRVLVAPDLIRVDLKGQGDAPNAVARGFWSQSQGIVFNAQGLPAIDISRVYQLWMFAGDKPVSAGTFTVDATGAGSLTVPASVATFAPDALAVSIERAGGVTAPEGPIVLMGTR